MVVVVVVVDTGEHSYHHEVKHRGMSAGHVALELNYVIFIFINNSEQMCNERLIYVRRVLFADH